MKRSRFLCVTATLLLATSAQAFLFGPKGDNNADEIWWSRPKFISDPAQEAKFLRLSDSGEATAE